MTNKWKFIGENFPKKYWKNSRPFITCFWHGRLLMVCFAWKAKSPFYMLISSHPDGKIIAHTVSYYGINTVPGSSSKGGTKALRVILGLLRNGKTIGITPDGPRGPKFKVSAGVLNIAKISGLDIIPVTFSTSKRIVLKSWDRFILALPFGRGVIMWGKPIKILPNLKEKKVFKQQQKVIENSLNELCQKADKFCGHDSL